METAYFCAYTKMQDTPVGVLTLAASESGLLWLGRGLPAAGPLARQFEWREDPSRSPACLAVTMSELDEYFAGSRRQFTVPLDLRGTGFQKACWQALLEIPYGETRSYADMAQRVALPRGFRAVGRANGSNRVSIIVPCHRVIASDRSLGGYGGGLEMKRFLLALEQRATLDVCRSARAAATAPAPS